MNPTVTAEQQNMNQTLININGREVWATPAQCEVASTIASARKGGMASIKGYQPTTGYIASPTVDYQIITRFSYSRMIARKLAALDALSFDDVRDAIAREPKLSALSEQEQREVFKARREQERASIERTQSGDRSDAHRQAHDTFYVRLADGIVAHLVTEKQGDDTVLVLTNGYPTIDALMVEGILINRKVRVDGQRKVVNSGAPVLMGNAIKRAIDIPGTSLQRFTLRDNFAALTIDGVEVTQDDLAA
jgi:hypothetical protein